jgi:hypothetical protein
MQGKGEVRTKLLQTALKVKTMLSGVIFYISWQELALQADSLKS